MRRSTIVVLASALIILIVVAYFVSVPEAGQQLLVDLELATPVARGYTVMGMLEAQFISLSAEDGGRVKSLPIDELTEEDLGWPVAMEPDGVMWMAIEGGVSRFDGKTSVTYTLDDGLGGYEVEAIAVDPDGAVWFGTERGAARYDGEMWINYTTEDGLGANRVLSIAAASDGVMWFGTDGGGVTRFDGENWITYNTDDDLAGDIVRSILLDTEGAVWFDTNGGVSRLDGETWDDFAVHEGETISQGEIVMSLDMSFLEAQRDAAQARCQAALAGLEMLEAGPREVDLAVVQAAVDHSQAVLEGALQALEDAKDTPRSVRDEQVAIAQAGVDQAQAALDATEAALVALEEGTAENELEAARAAVNAAAAELAQLEDQISRGEIRSPVDGVLLDRLFFPGELTLPGWPVATVADLNRLEVTVYLPESDLGWANVGELVQVSVDAYPDRIFNGLVIYISDRAEFTPRNVQTPEERVILVYEVRVLIPNPGRALKPGLPADVTFGVSP
ncbi:MAG TPA: HlyD family efflux transporter periplasmic adaptor subunit [Anaerolineae bacterium]|nr:HlyD family efflux transporter periplasmic adaptor subunit [Anaerolineae bacterium]